MLRATTRLAPLALVLAVVLLGGCSRTRPVAVAPQARAQALIDAANTAYRDSDYATAAKRYASASVVSPDDPAAYYGLGMALARLGRDDDARLAYGKARLLLARAADSARAR